MRVLLAGPFPRGFHFPVWTHVPGEAILRSMPQPPDLEKKFEVRLRETGLLKPGDKVFAACSGGPDSVALFRLLCGLRASWRLEIGLLHFHHGLRGREADLDLDFVRKIGRREKVPVYTGRGRVRDKARGKRQSIEEAAREARYGFFCEAARKHRIPKIALAHTLDDQAETVLMRICQGTGLRGLEGIRERLTAGPTEFVRPLIGFRKKEILDFIRKRGFTYRRDRSNTSVRYLRNRIRARILPLIEKEINPDAARALARIPAIVRDDNAMIGFYARKAVGDCVKKISKRKALLDRGAFLALPSSMQFRVLGHVLARLDARSGLDFNVWQKIKTSLVRKSCRHSLKRDIDFRLTPARLEVFKK